MLEQAQKPKVVTHNNSFHTDDVFSLASLELSVLRDREYELLRTRDEQKIREANIVFDVGAVHDGSRDRFDHHQPGGAGRRENGISYAAFGLVWKKYGEEVCGSAEVSALVDKRLVQFIDTMDNGDGELRSVKADVKPYSIKAAIDQFNPDWRIEMPDYDSAYRQAVLFAKGVLEREIKYSQSVVECRSVLKAIYDGTADKRIIVLEKDYPWEEILNKYPEPIFVLVPRLQDNGQSTWRVGAVRDDYTSFQNRKDFPKEWAGKRDDELAKLSGVSDAVYCANGRFVAYAKSKEGAIKLAELALNA